MIVMDPSLGKYTLSQMASSNLTDVPQAGKAEGLGLKYLIYSVPIFALKNAGKVGPCLEIED